MPKIERREIMLGVHYAVDVDSEVSEEAMAAVGAELTRRLENAMLIGDPASRYATGVTLEEIRGGEQSGLPDLIVSATPETWPIGCYLHCVKPDKEGEPSLLAWSVYVLKSYDAKTGMIETVYGIYKVTVSASRFIYLANPNAKVGNGL